MKVITRKISLDLSRKSNTRITFASQADYKSREFIITLLDDGMPYFVEKTVTATVNVRRPDGTNTAYMAQITDDGCIKYVAGMWALRLPGEVKFSVSLYDGDQKKISSSYFSVMVEEGLHLGSEINDGDESHTAFYDMMNTLASFKLDEQAREEAETERENNESIRAGFEIDRAAAEGERAEAEIARENAEISRMEAEAQRVRNEQVRMLNENSRLEVTDNLKTALSNLLTLQDIYIARGESV